jgi:hypothetical protein
MSKYTDGLWQDLVREHGSKLAHADRPDLSRVRVLRHPRVLAIGTLGLTGLGAALALALSGGTPAYAITTNSDGSVLVTINQTSALPQANAKLASMGTDEAISIQMASGPAAISGPVRCTSGVGVSGPKVTVLVGTNGTELIPANNSGAGAWHLGACFVQNSGTTGPTSTGNSGNG